MTEYTAKRNAKRCPTHPGAVLREDVLPAVKRPKTAWKDLALLKQHRCYGHHFTSTSSRRRSIRSSLEIDAIDPFMYACLAFSHRGNTVL